MKQTCDIILIDDRNDVMRKNRRRKIITLIIVFTLLLGFVIGFSAFSSQLLIKLKANVKPNSNDFKVVFSSNSTTLETDPIKATKTGNITADDAIINNINGAPTITNLNATFKKPGDKVEYNFYVLIMQTAKVHLKYANQILQRHL